MEETRTQVTPQLAEALVRSLFCGFRRNEKRMAVFVGFSDESASQDPCGPFLIAGYVAPETTWPFVASAWAERVLETPPRIPYLHMIEIRRREWQRKYGLSALAVEDKIDEAARVVAATGDLARVVSVIDRSDLEDIVQRHCRERGVLASTKGINEPDYIAFMAYAYVVAVNYVHNTCPDAEKLDLVIDRKRKVSNNLKGFYKFKKDAPEEYPLSHLVGDVIPASMEERNPLQAADVFAWHERRFFERGTMDRPCALLRGRPYIHKWTKEDLEQFRYDRLSAKSAKLRR